MKEFQESINKTIISLSEYIQKIIKDGSDEERLLLPELIKSLNNINPYYRHLPKD